MADIFLSYARADQPKVEKLAAALEAAGYSLWWDSQLHSGSRFAADIERALEEADHVLVAWSKDATQSRWVADEAAAGADQGKLVALTLDGSPPPIGFRQYHATDMSGWKGGELPHALLAGLGSQATPSSVVARSRNTAPKSVIIAALSLALLLAGGWWWMQRGGESDGNAAEAALDQSKSIAILPFRDLSPGQDQGWFTDGLAEEITTTLARAPDLVVAPRAAAFQYRGGDTPPAEAAAQLGVAHILDGSVRRDGDDMRVSVELLRASDGQRVWSQTYDRSTDDAIQVQEEIATAVARALETAMDPEALAAMVDMGTRSVEAYEAYLRSNEAVQDIDRAFESLDLAVRAYELDPNFGRAYIRAAESRRARTSAFTFQFIDRDAALAAAPQFEREIALAIEKANDPADRQWAQALQALYRFDLKRARDLYARVVEARPNYVDARTPLVATQIFVGDKKGAEGTVDTIARDFPQQGGEIIQQYWSAGRLDKSLDFARRALADMPNDSNVLYQAHRSNMWAGNAEAGARLIERMRAIGVGDNSLALAELRQACLEGRLDDAERALERARKADSFPVQALLVIGREQEAYAMIRSFDREQPPILLAELVSHPNIDLTRIPNLARLLREQGIEPHKAQPMPYACRPDDRPKN